MNSKAIGIIFFFCGFVCGFSVGRRYAKKECEKIAQESSQKDFFDSADLIDQDCIKDEYEQLINEHRYYGGARDKSSTYLITPDEYGENEEYETIELTYYADGVLADDSDDIIGNVEETIGKDALGHFGDYEDDAVFVRNDDRKADFEIVLDLRRYSDVVGGSGKEDS